MNTKGNDKFRIYGYVRARSKDRKKSYVSSLEGSYCTVIDTVLVTIKGYESMSWVVIQMDFSFNNIIFASIISDIFYILK